MVITIYNRLNCHIKYLLKMLVEKCAYTIEIVLLASYSYMADLLTIYILTYAINSMQMQKLK